MSRGAVVPVMAFALGALGLGAVGLGACGGDAAPSDSADDAADDVASEVVGDVAEEVVDALPANAGQLYARLKGQLVNGRTTVIAAPGDDLEITFDYTVWSPPECADCAAQILVATSDGTRIGCAYDAVPGVYPGVKGHAAVTLQAPAATGTYGVRWKLVQAESCEVAIAAYPAEPAPESETLFEFLVQ